MGARFSVFAESQDSPARACVFYTAHGPIETPAFMPVGTSAAVRGLSPAELRIIGAECVLANTYHLWLRPGPAVIEQAGGLHCFMGWNGPILTDSGGFQVLSLRDRCVVDEAGATFRSHFDGDNHLLTPELAMEAQAMLGSDIAMALDVCPPHPCSPQDLEDAAERTLRWAERSLAARHASHQAVFGIVQGGTNLDLRATMASALSDMPFDGYGIGGLSIGEQRDQTWPALSASIAHLAADRPRYLMGVGAPADLLEGISHGVDLFDCVLPTRLGRTGTVFTADGEADLRQARYQRSDAPIDSDCDCRTCESFSLGYLHYLFRAGEELAMRLASLHNLRFLLRLVADARQAICDGDYGSFSPAALARLRRPTPVDQA